MKKWLDYPMSFVTTGAVLADVALVFLVAEFFLYPDDFTTAALLTLVPMLFFIGLSTLELKVTEEKRRAKSGTLIGTYMLFKGLRLLVTLIAVAIYIYVGAPLRMLFITTVLTFFALALILTSICHLHAERKTE